MVRRQKVATQGQSVNDSITRVCSLSCAPGLAPCRRRRLGVPARLRRDAGQVVQQPAILARLSGAGFLGLPALARSEGCRSGGNDDSLGGAGAAVIRRGAPPPRGVLLLQLAGGSVPAPDP